MTFGFIVFAATVGGLLLIILVLGIVIVRRRRRSSTEPVSVETPDPTPEQPQQKTSTRPRPTSLAPPEIPETNPKCLKKARNHGSRASERLAIM